MRLDAEEIKRQAAGRWPDILRGVCRLTDEQLNPRVHCPCPKCGGTDRFRALDDVAETGGMFCNQCFNTRNGDGFAVIQWYLDVPFQTSLKLVADALGQQTTSNQSPAKAKQPAKEKTVHPTAEKAADAIAWGMVQNGILSEQRKPDAGWRYRNADGSDAGSVYRWNLPDGRKEIRQVSKVEGGWITSAIAEPRPLYRLPDIIDAEEVWICEGEKSADAAVSLGLLATTSAGGSGAAEKSDWSTLKGKQIYIVPDNDDPGRKYCEEVCRLIFEQTTVDEIHIANLTNDWPAIPAGGDVFDWQEQFDSADAETLQARLRASANDLVHRPDKDNQVGKLVFRDAWQAAFKPRPLRQCVIEGLVRRAEVANIIAATKFGKSWFALILLICVSTGRDWLGRRVARGNVLLIDNELHSETIENRLSAVRYAMQIEPDEHRERFEYVSCRGDWVSIQDLIEGIPAKHPPGSLNLIVIDAKYRLFGNGLEENSNDDQTTFHNMIDQFAKVMDCPIVLVHHATKGDQSGKAVTDMGSGGGSQSRAVDCHMTIRPHQQPGLAVLEAAVRSFAPVEPITLRWNWPLWTVADDVEPALPTNSKDAERVSAMQTKVLRYLSEDWISLSRLAERCSTKKDRNPFADIIDELKESGTIEISEDYVPPNSRKATTGLRLTSDKMTSDTVQGSVSDVRGLTSDRLPPRQP